MRRTPTKRRMDDERARTVHADDVGLAGLDQRPGLAVRDAVEALRQLVGARFHA